MAGVELRDYQEDAVRQMRNGCILCGGVGSGKSRTSLAYYYVRNGGELGTNEYVPMDDVNIKDLYIITTARKRDTFEWEEELSPFLLSTNKKENLYTNIGTFQKRSSLAKSGWRSLSILEISFRKSLEFTIHILLTITSSMYVSRNFMEGIWTIGTS